MTISFSQTGNRLFFIIISVGIFLFGMIFAAAYRILPQAWTTARTLLGKSVSTCDCQTVLSSVATPGNAFLMVAALFVLASFAIWTLYHTVKLLYKTYSFVRRYSRDSVQKGGVHIFKHTKPLVFCAGFFRPKIYMATGVMDALNKEERAAVILHEQAHKRAFEPLRLFVVKLCTRIFSFVPGFVGLAKRYETFAELNADAHAAAGSKQPLARALYTLIGLHEQEPVMNTISLSFFSSVTEERIAVLTQAKYTPQLALLTPSFKLGLMGVLFIATFVWSLLFTPTSVFAESTVGSCQGALVEPAVRCELQEVWFCSNYSSIPACHRG